MKSCISCDGCPFHVGIQPLSSPMLGTSQPMVGNEESFKRLSPGRCRKGFHLERKLVKWPSDTKMDYYDIDWHDFCFDDCRHVHREPGGFWPGVMPYEYMTDIMRVSLVPKDLMVNSEPVSRLADILSKRPSEWTPDEHEFVRAVEEAKGMRKGELTLAAI